MRVAIPSSLAARATEKVQQWNTESSAKLRETARRLREDPAAIEEIARRELGLIKRGERVFIVKDLPSPAKP